MTRTTLNMTISTAATALLGMFVLGQVQYWLANPEFSLWGSAVLFLAAAFILGATTSMKGWAQMIGADTSIKTVVKCLSLAAAVALFFRGVDSLVARAILPMEIQGLRLYFFKFTSSAWWLRSLIGSPITEELFFRGALLAWFDRQALTPVRLLGVQLNTASLLSSLAFAMTHIFNKPLDWLAVISLILVFGIGLLMVAVRRKTGGLLIPMLCHALINFGNAFLVFA